MKSSNAAWFSPEKSSYRIPDIGSHVSVYFVDGNIRFGYWSEFSPNNDYSIISDEKYKILATMAIGTKTFDIRESDVIKISLPGNMDSSYAEDGKTKTVTIKDNNTSYATMKEQIDVLNKNNAYMLKRIISDIETSALTKIGTYYSSISDGIKTAISASYSQYTGTTIGEYLSGIGEIYETDDYETNLGYMESIFEEASKSAASKTYYDGKSQSTAFTAVETKVASDINSALTADYSKPEALTGYSADIKKRLATTATLRFEYPNTISVNKGTTEAPDYESDTYLEESENLFDSVSISGLSLTAPTMKYDGLSWSIFRYWCTDSELTTQVSDPLTVSGDLILYPKFFAIEINPVKGATETEYILNILGNSDSAYAISQLSVKYGPSGSTLASDSGLTEAVLTASDGIYSFKASDYPSDQDDYFLYIQYTPTGGTMTTDRISINALFN